MSAGTETVLQEGMAFGCLDSGGMLIDRDSGEYVPADQVIHGPLHIDKLDFLQEDHLGPLKATLSLDDEESDEESVHARGDDVIHDALSAPTFTHDAEDGLYMPYDEHLDESLDLYVPYSSPKARWAEFRSKKRGRK